MYMVIRTGNRHPSCFLPFKFLAISSNSDTDVCHYPDSKKTNASGKVMQNGLLTPYVAKFSFVTFVLVNVHSLPISPLHPLLY